MPKDYAFVTLLTSTAYLAGALTAIHSLKDAEGNAPANDFDTVCLVTPATVDVQAIKQLRNVFDLVVGVEAIESSSHRELAILGRPDLKATLTKLHVWRLIQYKKVIYLDADTLVLRALSHLFTTTPSDPKIISAAPDIGWPDCFNSGVMVISPDSQTFDHLRQRSSSKGSWDGGDQGLLNDHFENWNRLSFTYNVTPSNYYQYEPAMQRYGHTISILHFIGATKPWDRLHRSRPNTLVPGRPVSAESANDYNGFLHRWYDVFERHYGQTSTAALASSSFGTFNPTQGNFVVPSYTNAWDQPGQITYRPPNPEDLKHMFGGVLAGSTGGYTTMPLEKGDSQPQTIQEDQKRRSPPRVHFDDEAATDQQQQGPSHQQARPSSPPVTAWDASKSGPQGFTKFQMERPIDDHYDNVWDKPSAESHQFFQPPSTYNPIPAEIHSQYTNSMKGREASSKTAFPWESNADSTATRRFPDSPAIAKASTSTRPVSTPPVVSPPASAASFSQNYSNAWDSIQGIRKYADSIQKPKQQASWRASATGRDPNDTALKAKYGVPARRSSSTERDRGDEGDDEDDEDERPPIKLKQKPEISPITPQSTFFKRPLMNRAEGSIGSSSRLPTISGGIISITGNGPDSPPPIDLKTGLAKSNILPGTHEQSHTSTSAAHATTHSTSSQPVASRVFHPQTDTNIVKKEGLAALQRFVQSMESKGASSPTGTRPR